MERQSKLDLMAAAAIGIMFLGAAVLTVSAMGIVLIIAGGVAMLALFLAVVRQKP